ncbi:MAG: membrane protein insertase YidC [bacterium]
MEEKNLIIFMILTVGIVMLWMMFYGDQFEPAPAGKQGRPGSTVSKQGRPGSTVSPPAGDTAGGLKDEPPPTVPSEGPAELPDQRDTGKKPQAKKQPKIEQMEQTVSVSTEVFEVEFTNVGAAPKHWYLLEYNNEKCFPVQVNVAWPPVDTDPPCDPSPVDLIDQSKAPYYYTLNSQLSIDNKIEVDPWEVWEIESSDLELTDDRPEGEVSFKTELDDGRVVHKTYRFSNSSYAVDLTYTIEGEKPNRARADISMLYTYDPGLKAGVPRWNFNGPIAMAAKLEKIDPDDVVDDGSIVVENLEWAGFTSDYFLSAVLSENDFSYQVKYTGNEKEEEDETRTLTGWVRVPATGEEIQQGTLAGVRVFMGPKNERILGPVKDSLVQSIDYGMLGVLVKPLITALYYLHQVIPNYGVAIIILTIIIRMALFPLTRTSQKSMKQMQKLQPEIKKLREEYKDDKMKQQEEIQALWKRHKVNPAMGCLPMLLQFPVFFAIYKALLISIELRHAPFMWWIIDLSSRDPLYIWPIAMGATQLVTQKMTPTQMDSTQAKLFLAMPIVFTFILRNFPAGLLIYWTVQNMVGIAQQIYVNRQPD